MQVIFFLTSFFTVIYSELECNFDTTPFDEGSVVKPVSVTALDLNAYSGDSDDDADADADAMLMRCC
jgi:hypothetical protein